MESVRGSLTRRDCLSSLELLELAFSDSGSQELEPARQHLAHCRRCTALAALFDDESRQRTEELAAAVELSDELSARIKADASQAAQREQAITDDGVNRNRSRTGEVWLARASNDYNETVAVIGRRPDDPDLIWVAPISDETEMAAEGDVIADKSLLGYELLVCAWNSGAIKPDQLEIYRGRLAEDDRKTLAMAFNAWLGDEVSSAPPGHAPIVGPEDPRLAWRAGFQDRTRDLFGAVDREFDQAPQEAADEEGVGPAVVADAPESPADEPEPAHGTRVRTRPGPQNHTTTVLFSAYLREQMDEHGWDEVSLAERAELDTLQLRAFLTDKFDLAWRKDTAALAAVIRIVSGDVADPEAVLEGPLRNSLLLSEGGMPQATNDQGLARAASSFAGVSDDERDRDIERGQYEIDQSTAGHQAAVDTYIADVRAELV
jgi:hypothetical protein